MVIESELGTGQVALLAEGVDRNCPRRDEAGQKGRSPSSRRAWIEICAALAQ